METDLYAILQVAPHAEPEVIEAVWRRLSKKYHPDVNKSPDANERMKAINHAYDVLRDPAERARYDRKRESEQAAEPIRRPRRKRTARPKTRATARRGTTAKPSGSRRKTVKEELDVSETLVGRAVKLSKTHPLVSSALLQKHLGLSYPRAVYLFATLIEKGIIDEHGNWTLK